MRVGYWTVNEAVLIKGLIEKGGRAAEIHRTVLTELT
jgi:hypothetical protein